VDGVEIHMHESGHLRDRNQWWTNLKSNLMCQISDLQAFNLKSWLPNPNLKSQKIPESHTFIIQFSNHS